MSFSMEEIKELEARVLARMSEHRYIHTLGVRKCAEHLGAILLPDSVSALSAAALLHDITKELTYEEQLQMIKESAVSVTPEDIKSGGVLHSFTAPLVILRDFPRFATQEILSAVACHTLGKADMSIFDKIIYIADYIEEGRRYSSCIAVRDFLLDGFDELSPEDKLERLDRAIIMSIDLNAEHLARDGRSINGRMFLTRDAIAAKY